MRPRIDYKPDQSQKHGELYPRIDYKPDQSQKHGELYPRIDYKPDQSEKHGELYPRIDYKPDQSQKYGELYFKRRILLSDHIKTYDSNNIFLNSAQKSEGVNLTYLFGSIEH